MIFNAPKSVIGCITDLRFLEAIDKSADPREIVKIAVVLVESYKVTMANMTVVNMINSIITYV